jgi:hypothetical protein
MPPHCIVSLPENAIIFPISAEIRAALSHFDERRKMRPSDVRRLRRLRSRAAILAANGGKDRDSIGAREARVRSIDGPDLADLIEDRSGILADLVAGWKADDERILADLARSSGYPAKADPIDGAKGPDRRRIKSES